MGMFDWVQFEMECPTCGKSLDSFQSKDGACVMDSIHPITVRNFYDFCDECKTEVMFVGITEPVAKYELQVNGKRVRTYFISADKQYGVPKNVEGNNAN